MKITRFFILFLLVSLFSNSIVGNINQTRILGYAEEFKLQRLVFYKIQDYLTKEKKIIGETTVKSNGKFEFSLLESEVTNIYLKLENRTTHFLIEPGKVYNINLSKNKAEEKQRIYDKRLNLNILYLNPTDLNYQISKINQKIDSFLSQNDAYFSIKNEKIFKIVADFRNQMIKKYISNPNSFIKQHVKYSVANIELGLSVLNIKDFKPRNIRNQIFKTYFYKQPVLYNTASYITLFKRYYKNIFKQITLTPKGYALTQSINDYASYQKSKMALDKYFTFKDPEFKDLFLLNGLLEIKTDPFFKRRNILKILNQIMLHGTNAKIKLIALNILKLYTFKKLTSNTQAPDFTLKDINDKKYRLTNFKNQVLYINFFAYWSIPSLKEMKIIEKLYKLYKGKITFISICVDRDKQKLKEFLRINKNYKWTFLWMPHKNELMDNYNIKVIPTYALINKNQKFISYPAPNPLSGIEKDKKAGITEIFDNILKNN